MENKTAQLSLPYEEIKKVAGRNYMRDNFKAGTQVSYKIPFNKILVREGYNKRTIYDGIEELAESLYVHGQQESFVLDVLHDGRYFIKRGHRRHKAYLLLIEQGKFNPETEVEFFPSKTTETELDRVIDQYTSNNLQSPLKPIEQAAVVYTAKFHFGKKFSHEELADMFGMSRQKIDNLILFAEQSDDVKLAISGMKFTNALEYIRNQKSLKKQADKAEESAGQSSMSIAKNGKDINADEEKALNDLEKDIALNEGDGFVNTETGEVVTHIPTDQEVNHNFPAALEGSASPISPSVFTEPVATREKGMYDESRVEIQQIQNIIKLLDKVDNIASKLPDPQASKDICDRVKWMLKDAEELRTWVHKNKKQNKSR